MSYKLTETDYHHIWLRFKDKIGKWVFSWIAITSSIVLVIISLITFLGLRYYIQSKADEHIENLIKSESFQTELLEKLSSQVEQIDENYSHILQRLSESENLLNVPYHIDEYGFEIFDNEGKRIIVEFGVGETNIEKSFNKQFFSAPTVVVTNYDESAFQPGKYRNFQPTLLAVKEITEDSFLVATETYLHRIEFNFIAIGYSHN